MYNINIYIDLLNKPVNIVKYALFIIEIIK